MFLSKSYVWLPRKFKNQYFLFYSYIFLATNQSTKTQKKKKKKKLPIWNLQQIKQKPQAIRTQQINS